MFLSVRPRSEWRETTGRNEAGVIAVRQQIPVKMASLRWTLALSSFFLLAAPSAPAQIIITEIMFNPAGDEDLWGTVLLVR
jgi:hypothetical protein